MKQYTEIWRGIEAVIERIAFDPLFKKVLNVSAYVVAPMIVLASLFVKGVPYAWHVQAGSLAQILLLVVLFMKPLGIVFGIRILKRLLPYRRQMGVIVFYLALFHFGGLVQLERVFDSTYYTITNHVLYGAAALVMLGLLWATSNNRAMRLLRRNWKRLHYLAYPALLLVLLHASMVSGEMQKIIVLGSAFIVLKALEWRGTKIKLPIISS